MTIHLSTAKREKILADLHAFFREDMDQDLSTFRADQLLDFVLTRLGPPLYNQAVQDARAFMQTHLDDLDGEVYAAEE